MKFTISRQDLEFLLKGAGVSRPKGKDAIKLFACAARVFVESKGDVAGIEALVLADGGVTVPAKIFSSLLKTYADTKFLNVEGSNKGLQINTFTMPVLAYESKPVPPANFKIFPTTGVPYQDVVMRARQ